MTDFEEAIRRCYSTWSETYYDDYYGDKASYPPVHRELLRKILREHKVSSLLDAGCGPASFLRDMINEGIELYGFDLTSEMVNEGKKVFAALGLPPGRIWEGDVLDPKSFRCPNELERKEFDASVCFGVLPHIPLEDDITILQNLHNAVKQNGLVIVEARNQFFGLFTLNRYSYQFFVDELIQAEKLKKKAGIHLSQIEEALEEMKQQFRMDFPPLRKGKQGKPGYDEILSRTHNPVILREQFSETGFQDVKILFYHYHCLPPMLGSKLPELFLQESLLMENPEDWRGYFMASAFLITGNRA